jgi:WD40 repeat protein
VIYGVAFTSDSQHLVTCGEDATVRLWSLDEAAELARLEGPNCTCRALAVSTVTNVIAAVGDDGRIYLWDYDPRSPTRMSQSGAGLSP